MPDSLYCCIVYVSTACRESKVLECYLECACAVAESSCVLVDFGAVVCPAAVWAFLIRLAWNQSRKGSRVMMFEKENGLVGLGVGIVVGV